MKLYLQHPYRNCNVGLVTIKGVVITNFPGQKILRFGMFIVTLIARTYDVLNLPMLTLGVQGVHFINGVEIPRFPGL